MREKILWGLFVMLDILFITGNISAKTIHIPTDYSTIQEGVDSANSGDTVLVAKGTYSGGIDMQNGVYLKSEEGPDSTIISGSVNAYVSIVTCDSLTDTVTIDGFTICNASKYSYPGGGISSCNSNVIIKNNIIRDNRDTYPNLTFNVAGGGIYIKGGSVLIESNIIRSNKAMSDWAKNRKMSIPGRGNGGGGIYAESTMVIIRSNVIDSNSAGGSSWYGGGISCIECFKAIIFNNLINSNYTGSLWGDSQGSGIYCTPPVIIINNTIVNNGIDTLYDRDGGIYCEKGVAGGQDSIIIRDNVIAFNMARRGAGIFCSDSLDSRKILISCNDFYLNIQDDFYNVPTGVGDFSWGSNRNGISCDSFYNINIDPGFTGGPRGNYYQQNVIDCGDYIVGEEFNEMSNTSDGKPDTGWVDLGYHYQAGIGVEEDVMLNEVKHLLKASPNPFTIETSIEFRVKSSELKALQLQIYDITGKLVKGTKENIIGKDLLSGIYFVKVKGYKPIKIVKIGRVK